MRHWIFQGNPDRFDVDGYLTTAKTFRWLVRQKHLAASMSGGDEVFIWRSKGGSNKSFGVVAIANIVGGPKVMPDDKKAEPFWKAGDPREPALRVNLSLNTLCSGSKRMVKGDWLYVDPILSELRILKMRSETNYAITANEANRLAMLVRNTGSAWSREECIAALWAYKETRGKEVSKVSGSPVATVALKIGRAVSGCYNKLMNFRAIDPTDERSGFTSGSHVDKEVWVEFSEASGNILKERDIDEAFMLYWGDNSTFTEFKYKDFGQAPKDDAFELEQFSRRVRRGQPAFRTRLLEAYGYQCAISGWGPESVLEAAHILPHADTGINHPDNGLLLRADLHTLFDENLVKVNPDSLLVEVDESLRDTDYFGLYNNVPLSKRTDGTEPSRECLRKRYNTPSD